MDKNLKVWFTTPEKKILPKSHLTWGKVEDYHIYVAKNATEGCQVSIMAPDDRRDMKIEVLGADDSFTVSLLKEHYVDCEGAKWPDPVVPDNGNFSLEAGINTTYLINIKTTPETVAGEYNLKAVLYEQGEIYGEYPITVTVWNFSISNDDRTYMLSDINKQFVLKHQKTDDPEGLIKKYYDFLLYEYHTCPYLLPYDFSDSRIDEYLDDPRVKAFCLHSARYTDEQLSAIHKKLSAKKEWLDKCFIEVTDEPCVMAHYEKQKEEYARVSKAFPNPPVYTAFFKDPDDGNGAKATDLLSYSSKIWIPKSTLFKTAEFRDCMEMHRSHGDNILWYVCWEPGLPYANMFVDMDGFYHRALFWQQYMYKASALCYWTTTWWRDCNPWDSASTVRDLSMYCFGDGSLLYPGDRVGIDGPVGSLRLEIARSAMEDFAMLKMAERAFGRAWVEENITCVTPSVREYNDDHNELDRTRIIIGNKLSEYYSK